MTYSPHRNDSTQSRKNNIAKLANAGFASRLRQPTNQAKNHTVMSAIASAAATLNRQIPGREALRFGSYPFRVDQFVVMPDGLPGFRGYHDFALITPYEGRLAPYKLLQSLKSHKISFIVTELGNAGVSIAPKDLKELASAAGLRVEQAIFLLIVSVRHRSDGLVTTVNLRAPIVLDPKTRVARQCVTSKAQYQVQQPLFGHAAAALGA